MCHNAKKVREIWLDHEKDPQLVYRAADKIVFLLNEYYREAETQNKIRC